MSDLDQNGNEALDAELVLDEVGQENSDSDIETLESISEEQRQELEDFAFRFLSTVIKLRGVRIDREKFLKSELQKRGFSTDVIVEAIESSPAAAGIGIKVLDKIAESAISHETNNASILSFATGLPGGFAILATVPADLTQFYVHAFRVMQKIAYIYGWKDFLEDLDEVDDETLTKFLVLLGVMVGAVGAAKSVQKFAIQVARPAIQNQIARKALTRTVWYPVLKSTLRTVGVKLTRDSLAKTVTKTVPVAGGVVSGSLTFVALKSQSTRLMKHLREIPPPNVDAAEYMAKLNESSEQDPSRARVVLASVSDGVADTSEAVLTQVRSGLGVANSAVRGGAKGAKSGVKGAANEASKRIKSLKPRKGSLDRNQKVSEDVNPEVSD